MSTLLTKNAKKSLDFINAVMNKKALNNLLSHIYLEFGGARTAHLANSLKTLGFKYATKAGTTISIADLDVPKSKKDLLAKAEEEIEKSTQRYLRGEITEVERYTKVIDTWSETTENLTKTVVENFDRLNPVYMMAFSGARGNVSQVSQLVGMRGLMADAQGQIIDLPIKTNFREGLSVTEYIISSYGARKGLVDTALKTADSGYLTRRLVDVAQDVIIRDVDCGTTKGILLSAISDGEKNIVSLEDRLLGRTAADTIKDTEGNVLVEPGQTIDKEQLEAISAAGIKTVKVRSGLTCELDYGVCQKCYGWSLTSSKPVDIGEAIGIIAAQSIGEPGTQLTMRTFHTGGVFRGSNFMKKVEAGHDGEISSVPETKELRTRHGDVVQVAVKDSNIELKDKAGKTFKIHLQIGATVFVKKGDVVKRKDVVAEFEPGAGQGDSGRLTEKATKDITSDISGKILFDGFAADEKRDRQGNISRTATRGGTIWVLSGDVYNLPGGSKIVVKDGQEVKEGDILAETSTICEHGGEVRIGSDMEIEEIKVGSKKIKKIVNGKELTIVIASISPKNAVFEKTKKEQIWRVESTGEEYIVKCPVDTVVENGMIIAELLDEENVAASSGEVRYIDVEVDEHQIITKPGKVVFIPEEIHQVNKDINLKLVEAGTFVKAGTEVVKDLICHIDGIVEYKEYNDIILEVIVRPGEIHKIDDVSALKVEDGEIVEKGTEIIKGIKAKEKSIITFNVAESAAAIGLIDEIDEDDFIEADDDTEESSVPQNAEILIRPVQEFEIRQKPVSIEFGSTDDSINLVPVTQLQYRDGSRVRNLDGASLTRTSLVLQMQGYLSMLKGQVEFDNPDAEDKNLKIVVLESLIVRREVEDSTRKTNPLQTELLVENGQVIDPKTPIAKTKVLAVNNATVNMPSNKEGETRRLLLISENADVEVAVKGKATVKKGDLIRVNQVISDSGETATISGYATNVTAKGITVRGGRPYLISPGTMLQVDNESLVMRGDLLATLVFERQKTGDIVQGLPRVEELLEGRKPKESAILAEEDGFAELEDDDGSLRLYIAGENGRSEVKVPIDSNIIVTNKQKIVKGQPLTGGPLNPHDVIRLSGKEAVQQYLVDEVQKVYRSQGVEIADKHIETIVRQMTKKVKVEESGDSKLLPGELVELHDINAENAEVEKIGGTLTTFEPVLLGITKASLNTESFISAASFQETTRILTEVAVEGKKDQLRGLKENVIIGRLIPAGTGYYHLSHASEEAEASKNRSARNNARKPSAILEEIEGMFGSPDFTIE